MPNFPSENMCIGCTACKHICPKQCIEMEPDQYGFVFPKVTKTEGCIECGACERACPVLKYKDQGLDLPSVYAAYSKDDVLRENSSSGGIFAEIAKVVLARNGVVCGATYNDEFEVYHCFVDSVDELPKLQGAKYSESCLGNIFSEILERLIKGQFVLFVGTPCQVAGLKSFVKKNYDNLCCMDFVCHGVPSPMAWKEYVKFRAKTDANGEMPVEINLRSKHTGWSKYQYSNLFRYENGYEHSDISSQSLFMKLFFGDYISRPSCENCLFKGYARISDITVGDFWGIWDIDDTLDDNRGTSVVLVQTEKGSNLWREIENRIHFKQVTLEQSSLYNPSMIAVSKSKKEREKVLKFIKRGRIGECDKLLKATRCQIFTQKIRSVARYVIKRRKNSRN